MQTIVLGHAIYNPCQNKYVDVRPRDHHKAVALNKNYDGTVWLSKFKTRVPEPEDARRAPDRAEQILRYKQIFNENGELKRVQLRTPRQQKSYAKLLKYDPFRDGYYQTHIPDCLYTDVPVQFFETRKDVQDLVWQAFGTDFETLGFEVRRVAPFTITGYFE